MKISLTDFTIKIEKQDYIEDLETTKYADVSKSKTKLREQAAKLVKETKAALKHNSLSHIALEITGQRPITFALETNMINLPYSNYKKNANFFEEGKEYPVAVYFETQSEYLNASGFRIDQIATEAEIEQNEAEVVAKLTDAMQEKIKQVREFQKPAASAKKNTTVKKPKTKKSQKETKSKK
ncbi:hypothetical protein [Lactobacillus melliventris]|uniref:Uncharacterized protein n=1 Tax=Lactobacillus melliventris TaxID=1218507 RepID=A0A0F4LAT7_9LACO|nr:hypothetical protein [Lactobacillus melliventris]KJY55725.1 uncharacterized protein JF74_15740 [Lactobacillus melliventris]